jgi:hypothetical protein
MKTRDEILTILKELKPEMTQKGINELGLFGSSLHGNKNDTSDIDLLIDIETSSGFSLFDLCALENTLSEQLGEKVDLVIKKDLRPHIGKKILDEVIYV